MFKLGVVITVLLFPLIGFSGEFDSNWAVPEKISIIKADGFRVVGNFGNPGPNGGCQVPNQIFIKSSHPHFKEIYSLALLAFSAQKELHFHIRSCEPVSWISGSNTLSVLKDNAGHVDIR